MPRRLIFVKILGTGVNETLRCLSHEIKGLPAGTYHVFEMENGSTLYFNDFGVRSVLIADSIEALNH